MPKIIYCSMRRITVCVLLIGIVLYSFLFGYKNIDKEKILSEQENYKCIVSVWQIDTFEGGKGSRRQFLEKVAKSLEREEKGLYYLITDYTIEGAEEKMKSGVFPDIISFGLGVNVDGLKEIKNESGINGGSINGKTYLTCWCKGKYCLIKNDIKTKKKDFYSKVVVSKTEYTNPLVSLCLSDKKFSKIEVKAPLDAYMDFVSGNTEYLLGTQRDIERLKSREMTAEIIPLNEFCDLYQYIGILSNGEEKYEYSKKFITALLSEENQKLLKNISMFSPFYDIEFDDENLLNMQKEREKNTLSPYITKEKIIELQNLSSGILKNNVEINKIKNILI